MDIVYPFIGFISGVLIGLTGVGGGSITTPALLIISPLSPLEIVGTDLLFAFVTKVTASWAHLKSKNVNLKLILLLLAGSIPGAVAGIETVKWLERINGGFPESFVTRTIGIVILFVAGFTFLNQVEMVRKKGKKKPIIFLVLLGFVGGILVSITSVGAGAIYLTFLIYLFPYENVCLLIGTDIVHATFLTGFSAFLHGLAGNFNLKLLLLLLAGSLPGTLIGSRFAIRAPQILLRRVILLYLFGVGVIILLFR